MIWNARGGEAVVGDTRMCYAAFGQGEKVLVVLPGLSDGLATVKGKALLLAGPYRPFFGRYTVYMFSRKNDMPRGYTIRDMAADQAKALRSLGLAKVSVMGVSQGGMIAQYLAIDHPDIVGKLVLAVTALGANATVRACVGRWIGYAERGDHRALMIDTAGKSYSEARLKKYRKLYPIIGAVGRPKDYRRFLANAEAILTFDASRELSKIACPTLILGGGDDKTVGAEASRELNRAIAGSELYMYEGLGHAVYEEADDFYARVLDFLER